MTAKKYNFPPELLTAIEKENLIVFVGAGLSRELKNVNDQEIGNWDNLVLQILKNLKNDDTVPTIAVATDGGVSVIKDDGTVVDIRNIQDSSTFNFCMDVHFRRDGGLVWSADSAGNVAAPRFIQVLHEIPTSDFVHTSVAASNNIDEFYSRSTTSQGDFKFLSANGVKSDR